MNRDEHAQPEDREIAARWQTASCSEVIRQEFIDLHRSIDAETHNVKPACDASGRCCHFEKFDHRLYITGLEAALVLDRLIEKPSSEDIDQALERGDCPFLVSEQCSIHEHRPTGCRIFFCDPNATDWQHELYERVHDRIETLHEEHDIPYHYGEWRAMLRWNVLGENIQPLIRQRDDDSSGSDFVQVRLP